MLRHIALLLLLSIQYSVAAGEPKITVTPHQAYVIGKKIWENEGLGKIENLTVWNKGEAFPSFGIGHFIWYPSGVEESFTESFPALLRHLRKDIPLPAWLNEHTDAPWKNREAFYRQIDSPHMNELRNLLKNSIPQQIEFILQRMESALPLMLAALSDDARRAAIAQQFYRVAAHPNGIYALIDYINFKGEGTSPKERYKGEGWGLLQILETMPPNTEKVMEEFVHAADFVLTRRVNNAPRDETRWLPGWRKRIGTYLQPIDME